MVAKLLKHEFRASFRTLLPMHIILLAMGILCRVIQIFEHDGYTYNIIFASSVVMLCIGVVVTLVMTIANGISRFYKNLFTREGYLSFTLPVTPAQHIFAKLFTLLIQTVITVLVIVVSVCFAMDSDIFNEILKTFVFAFKRSIEWSGTFNIILVIIEAVLSVIAILSATYLLYYACIAVGQLARKNRVLAAFGTFFGHYILTQIIGTIFIILVSTGIINVEEFILTYIVNRTTQTVQVLLLLVILLYVLLAAVYYFIAHIIMKKRLNLE